MANQLLHTPEGVRDIYSDEFVRKTFLEERIGRTMRSFGYHPIQTPTFEYLDVFESDVGTTSSGDLYKFLDREGNTLVLRPDFTPAIARCAAKYFMDDAIPVRFCYNGCTFVNNSRYQGYLKESTQSGAELIGDASVGADAEMIALTVEVLRSVGLKDFQISVGHVDFLIGLFEEAGLGRETENQIRDLLLNRNFYAVDDLVSRADLSEDLIWLFGLLKDVMLTRDRLQEAEIRAAAYPKIAGALRRLTQLEDLLRIYGVEQYVFYEMAMVLEFNYYTGIIFSGYTYGSGEAVLKGGRYDNLLSSFGKDEPAIGFAVVIEQLMSALQRQKIQTPSAAGPIWLIYDPSMREEAVREAVRLRQNGENVELLPLGGLNTRESYLQYAGQFRVDDIRFFIGEEV